MQHSCAPNCFAFISQPVGEMHYVLRAVARIPAGTRLSVSLVNAYLTRAERRDELAREHRIPKCMCEACAVSDEEADLSDARRARMARVLSGQAFSELKRGETDAREILHESWAVAAPGGVMDQERVRIPHLEQTVWSECCKVATAWALQAHVRAFARATIDSTTQNVLTNLNAEIWRHQQLISDPTEQSGYGSRIAEIKRYHHELEQSGGVRPAFVDATAEQKLAKDHALLLSEPRWLEVVPLRDDDFLADAGPSAGADAAKKRRKKKVSVSHVL